MTNDPKEPVVQLSIGGEVERFAVINPRTLNLRGVAGEKLQGTVSIVPEDKYPFRVVSAQAREGRLNVTWREVKERGKTAYALSVENVKAEAGSYNDTVVLKTDSLLQPELDVRVFVYLRPLAAAEKKAQ
jgi:hypothetical protein